MNYSPQKIAVLITCHNRKKLTCRCLESLRGQGSSIELNVYLVDDGSTDGTSEAVKAVWSEVNVIPGDGDLWWNGGMNLAWSTAIASGRNYDAYLWLNDDVVLNDGAITGLLDDLRSISDGQGGAYIVVGGTMDPVTREQNYGAFATPYRNRPLRFELVEPAGHPVPCDTLGGNCVLITSEAQKVAGILNTTFKHIFGDIDYGIRAKRLGVKLFASSKYVGTNESNTVIGTWMDKDLPTVKRVAHKLKEDRSIIDKDWRKLVRAHSGLGPFAFVYSVTPYLRIMKLLKD